jgi:Domain of unknown function (DUF4129)
LQPPRNAPFALIAGAFLLALGPGRAAAQPVDAIREATQAAIRGLDLQLDLPRAPELLSWSWHWVPPEWALWGALILAGGLLLYFFVKEALPGIFPEGRGGWQESGGDPAAAAQQAQAAAASSAEALARDGRFAEAMHVLLLYSLAELRRRLQVHFADSLTSREILRQARISEAGRASLGDIVARVERSHFGDQAAGPADYRLCRDSFDRLAAALSDEPAQ